MFERQRAAALRAAVAASTGEAERIAAAAAAAADSLDEWGWAIALGSDSSSSDGGEEEAEEPPGPAPLPLGWLESVPRWEQLPDYPPQQTPSLAAQLAHVRAILQAAAASPAMAAPPAGFVGSGAELGPPVPVLLGAAVPPPPADAQQVAALLARCDEVEGALHEYDAAAVAARAAQHEKESLWAGHKSAADDAAHLQLEIAAAMDAARRGAVALRGRSAEVVPRDLEGLAFQLAEESASGAGSGGGDWPFAGLFKGGRQLVFVSQKEMAVAGVDAKVLVQVYLEGDKAAVQEALTPPQPPQPPPPPAPAAAASPEDEAAGMVAVEPAVPAPKPPAFDTVVISVAAAEAFPDGRLRAPLMLHLGCVAHAGAKWRPPPGQWRCVPAQVNAAEPGALPWVPLQRFTMARADGGPAFVDPELHGACLRLPLADMASRSLRCVEFVLKTRDERWLQQQGGPNGNFYADLPL